MNIACKDRERIFLDGTAEEWSALKTHAASCTACEKELNAWKDLSAAASELHQEWDSATLWPRIERELARQLVPSQPSWWRHFFGSWNPISLQWQTATAAILLFLLSASAIWFIRTPDRRRIPADQVFFNNRTVREVEKAELAYEQAIDKLDAQARPQLENASTPLLASYREKLQVLDSAIADLQAQAGINPANGHLRRQLLAMYQEKQDTLEQVLEAKQQ
jgi:hypothetical protein